VGAAPLLHAISPIRMTCVSRSWMTRSAPDDAWNHDSVDAVKANARISSSASDSKRAEKGVSSYFARSTDMVEVSDQSRSVTSRWDIHSAFHSLGGFPRHFVQYASNSGALRILSPIGCVEAPMIGVVRPGVIAFGDAPGRHSLFGGV